MKYTIHEESVKFSYMIIDLYKHLCTSNEYILSKQILRSGTSIGANIKESKFASSKRDFLHKMRIALKEASETAYRIDLLKYGGYHIGLASFSQIEDKALEMIKVITSIVKTTEENLKK